MEPSIPINHYLAAAKDTELRRLLRAKATATGRVQRALEDEEAADTAILDYINATYPAVPDADEPAGVA